MNQKELQGPIAEPKTELQAAVLDAVLLGGDLGRLDAAGRVSYMKAVCDSLGLNPLTKPFEYITLNGKLTMYAKKDCTEQLRRIHGVSITIVGREVTEGVFIVTARAEDKHGRQDESVGAVPIDRISGEARANAVMKAETKAKRRVTLSICGLGMLDETEVDSVPHYTLPPDAEIVAEIRAAVDQEPPPIDLTKSQVFKTTPAGGARKANEVPAKEGDEPSVVGQWTKIHTLRGELPGWDGDHSHPEHAYARALRGYKKLDGTPCTSSKELTLEQASNLITRMQGLADRKRAKFERMEAETRTIPI